MRMKKEGKGELYSVFFCVCGQPTCTHGCVTLVQQVALYLLISYGILHEYHFFVCGNFHMNIASTMHQLVLDLQSLDQWKHRWDPPPPNIARKKTIDQLVWLYHFSPTSCKVCKWIHEFVKCTHIRLHVCHVDVFFLHDRWRGCFYACNLLILSFVLIYILTGNILGANQLLRANHANFNLGNRINIQRAWEIG